MKFVFKITAIIVFFCIGKITAQGGQLCKYAVFYTAKQKGYKNFKAYVNKKVVIETVCAPNAQDTALNIIIYGLRKKSEGKKTPKEILLAKYPVTEKRYFGIGTSYDSTKNQLTISNDNEWTSTTTIYSFDSLGRVIKMESSFQGEASGPGVHSSFVYEYDSAKNSLLITSFQNFGPHEAIRTSVASMTMDATLSFPLCERTNYIMRGVESTYDYLYSNNLLKKIIKKEKKKDAAETTTVYKYRFDEI